MSTAWANGSRPLCCLLYTSSEIGAVCRKAGVLFHTDAVQAVGHVEIDVKAQNIDMLSLSGHKIHAPKGVGALYVRKGIRMVNFIDGGAQERNRRGGTENLASIVGLGTAVEAAAANIPERMAKIREKRDRLIDGILSAVPKTRLNGGREPRLAGNLNISFEAVEGEALLLRLDMMGICGSSGSACKMCIRDSIPPVRRAGVSPPDAFPLKVSAKPHRRSR